MDTLNLVYQGRASVDEGFYTMIVNASIHAVKLLYNSTLVSNKMCCHSQVVPVRFVYTETNETVPNMLW